ncbi:VOC family protein [Dysgonomonas sp. 521]|uniref:VOC family protein n=1 Tax=Dysgonomonas sp. 521 TaxID=2302932 RepID=UPI0021074820|nr:VOC family protein [Dysgonomonas sp. 521]
MEYQTLSPNIGVKSVNETVQFYTETLGFNLIMSVPALTGSLQWAMVANGGTTFMFQEMDNLTEEYPQLAGRPALGIMTFYVKMKGMQTLYEKLLGTGSIAKEMHKTFYGADEFAIFDNNGHILTITEDTVEPTAIKSYDNYFLPANNYQESVHFYSEVLGLEKKFEFAEQGMIAFKVGNEEPAIILKDKTKMPNTIPAIWIEVEDTKAVYEKMKAKGIVFLSEPFKIRTGWAVELNDPSGNRLGFTDYKRD